MFANNCKLLSQKVNGRNTFPCNIIIFSSDIEEELSESLCSESFPNFVMRSFSACTKIWFKNTIIKNYGLNMTNFKKLLNFYDCVQNLSNMK